MITSIAKATLIVESQPTSNFEKKINVSNPEQKI